MKFVDPVAMAKLALSHQPKGPSAIPAFGFRSKSHKSKAEVDVVRVLSGCGGEDGEQGRARLEQGYPFLRYASIHWISHTSRFQETSGTWGLWYQMVTCGHDLAVRPWPEQEGFNPLAPDLLTWSFQSRHFGLIRLIESVRGISEPETRQEMWSLAAQGDVELLDVLLEDNHALQIITEILQKASQGGYFEVVERLLATGKADIDAKDNYGCSPLSWAAQNGHKAVVKLLKSVK
jgi:hypothetical protein